MPYLDILVQNDYFELVNDLNVDEFADTFIATIEGGIFLAKMSNNTDRFFNTLNFLEKQVQNILTAQP